MEIRIRSVSKDFFSEGKKIKALSNVDLTIPANQIFTLLGPSGCGKTTLLRCIVGLETPDLGRDSHRGGNRLVQGKKHLCAPGKAGAEYGVSDLCHLAPHDSLR